jgi:hypothetical protein
LVLLLTSQLVAQLTNSEVDSDRDGLPDQLEQSLLEKFRPTFMVSANECDVAPAEFKADQETPSVAGKNGTIYGRAFPVSNPRGNAGALIELQYFHLWGNDCGRMGHAFDAEHVSVLVHGAERASPATEWRATHWYAAAHEDTVCDASSGAKASTLRAEQNGATVWISRGKHASFLSSENCSHGCGADRCEQVTELPRAALINLGELGAPMNGAVWIASVSWPLSGKFHADLTPALVAQIDARDNNSIVHLSTVPDSVRSVIGAGNAGVGGIEVGNEHTGSALSVATKKTGKSLKRSYGAVKKSLGVGPEDKPR